MTGRNPSDPLSLLAFLGSVHPWWQVVLVLLGLVFILLALWIGETD